jgi:hypothetical protein
MFLGTMFYGAGLGQALDDILGERVIFYDRVINPIVRMWDDPEKGRLTGLVVAQGANGQYRLLDIRRNEWLIDINKIETPLNFTVEIGRPIKLLGKREGEFYFVVKRIFHHEGPGRGMMMHMMKEGFLSPPPEHMMPLAESCASHENASATDDGVCPMQIQRSTGTEIMMDVRR